MAMVIKISFAIFMGLVYNIYKDIRLRAYRFYAASIQIGIWRQGRQPSRAFHLRNRKFPDPLGIVPLAVHRTERTTGCILNNVSLREVDHTGVAISWLVQFLVNEFRKIAQKGQSV